MLLDDEVYFDEVYPEYCSECRDVGPNHECGDGSADDPDDYADVSFEEDNTLLRAGFTAYCTGPFSKESRNEDYESEVRFDIVDKLEEESMMCLHYYVPEVLVRTASFNPGQTEVDRQQRSKDNGPDDDPHQSDTDSVFSDASSIPYPPHQRQRNSFNTSQLKEDFHDTVLQAHITLTGAMLDVANTFINTRM